MKNWNMSPVCFSRSNFGNGICLTISLYTISGQRKNKIKFAWNCAYSPIYISLCGKQTLPPRWPCITTLLITSSTSISRPLRTLFFSEYRQIQMKIKLEIQIQIQIQTHTHRGWLCITILLIRSSKSIPCPPLSTSPSIFCPVQRVKILLNWTTIQLQTHPILNNTSRCINGSCTKKSDFNRNQINVLTHSRLF